VSLNATAGGTGPFLTFAAQNISVYNTSSAGSAGTPFSPVELSGILGIQSVFRDVDGLQNSFFENLRLAGKIEPIFSFGLSTQDLSSIKSPDGLSGGVSVSLHDFSSILS
jgi:hypothetical protein